MADTSSGMEDQVQSRTHEEPRALWRDEDDERLTVPLAGPDARAPDGSVRGTKRLRKLRASPGEMTISGTEYQRRLRKQYVRPSPSSTNTRTDTTTDLNGCTRGLPGRLPQAHSSLDRHSRHGMLHYFVTC